MFRATVTRCFQSFKGQGVGASSRRRTKMTHENIVKRLHPVCAWGLLCLAPFAALSGCGSSGPYDYVPVSGTITYEDGSKIPLAGARLLFFPQDAPEIGSAVPRQAMANLDAEGGFDCATSYKYGDGLIPGKHKVVIQANPLVAGKLIFPKACNNESETPLVIDTADTPLAIKVPQP